MSAKDYPLLAVPPPSLPQAYAAIPQAYAHPAFSLSQLLAMVRAYWRVTLATTLGALLVTGIVSKLMPKTYQATATLMVDYNVSDPIAGKEFPSGLMGSYMSTQTQLLKSPAVLLPVIEELQLTANKRYSAGFKGDPNNLPEWVREQLLRKLIVEQGQWGSQLIYVTYKAPNAQEAARVANSIAEVYAEQQALRLTGPSSERARRFTDQVDDLRRRVDRAQEQLTAFRQKAGLIDNDAKFDLEMDRLTNLEHRLVEAQTQHRILEAQNRYATRDAVLASTSVQTLKTQLATLQARLAELSTTLGPRHPQVVELQSQIGVVRRALGSEVGAYTGNQQAQLAAVRSLERQLQRAVDESRLQVKHKRRIQDESAKYLLELESAQTLYKQALANYDQIVLTSGGGYNNVRFISRANPPPKASSPILLLNLALALVLGLFFGTVGPLLYEVFHRRVRCHDDLDRDFGIPVLMEFGSLPAETGAK